MASGEMFRGEPPDFGWVMDRVGMLETTINADLPKNDGANQT